MDKYIPNQRTIFFLSLTFPREINLMPKSEEIILRIKGLRE